MSAADVAAAGHDLIDHLTLVVEWCAPGALEHAHAMLAELGVWQVPTFVRLRGVVFPDEARRVTAHVLQRPTPALLAEWTEAARDGDKARLAAGAAVYRPQLAALRPMQDACVPAPGASSQLEK